MTDLKITEASLMTLSARLATPDGKEAVLRLARIIAKGAFEAMTAEEREALDTPEGMQAFREVWPEFVSAFLHRAR